MKRPLTAFSQTRSKARLEPRFALRPREEGSNLVLRGSEPKKAPAQRRRVFTGPVEDLSEEEVEDEEKPLLVKRLSSSAPPPPPPFDENGEEAARRHCVFFHNAPKKITEMELQRIFERAGSVKRLRIFREDGKSQGMGLCEYVAPEGALAAAHILDGEKIFPPSPAKIAEPARTLVSSQNNGKRNQRPRLQKRADPDKRVRTDSSPGSRKTISVKSEEVSLQLKPAAGKPPPPPPPVPVLRPRSARVETEVKPEVKEEQPAKILAPSEAADGRISFYTAKKPDVAEGKAKEEDDSDSVSRCTDNARDEAPEMPVAQEVSSEESDCEVPEEPPDQEQEDVEMKEAKTEPAKDEGSQPDVEESSCVYFHNVPFEVNEEDLLPLFERAGPVKALCLFKLQDGRSRGQGLCQYDLSSAAEKAVRVLKGCYLANPVSDSEKDSRELHVKIHQGSTAILSKGRAVGTPAVQR